MSQSHPQIEELRPDIIHICGLLEPYLLQGSLDFPDSVDEKKFELCSRIDGKLIDLLISNDSQLGLTKVHRWIFLIVLLSHPKASIIWLHYRAMLLVRDMNNLQCRQLWISFHAKSVISRLSEGEESGSISFKLLSEICVSISPREASEFLYKAAQHGANSTDMAPIIKRLAVTLCPQEKALIWASRDQDNFMLSHCIEIVKHKYSNTFKENTFQLQSTKSLDLKANITSTPRELPLFINDLPLNSFAYRYLKTTQDRGPFLPNSTTWLIENAYLSIHRNSKHSISFYIFDSEKRYLADLSNGLLPFISEDCLTLDRDCFFTADRFSHSVNICHFLYDEMMRLVAIENAYAEADTKDFRCPIIPLFPVSDWTKKCISIISPKTEILPLINPQKATYRLKKLIVSSDSSITHLHPSGLFSSVEHVNNIRELQSRLKFSMSYSSSIGDPERRLLILRDDAKTRRFAQQDSVISLFKHYGFVTISIGSMTFEDQINLFAQANVLSAVHGQALSNMIFMPPGACVLEFLPSTFGTHAYGMIAKALGYNYNWIECESINSSDDVYVEISLLEAKLELLINQIDLKTKSITK